MRRLVVVALATLGLSCAGSANMESVARCMEAMAQVACPPGTAPRSGSGGTSEIQAGGSAQSLQIGGSGEHVIACDYHCASICQCGIGRVEGDGAVVCSPCYGQAALAASTSPQADTRSRQRNTQQPVVQQHVAVQQPTVALDFTRPPLFEHHELTAPFMPDPFGILVRAGGAQAIAQAGIIDPTGGSCAGYVNAAQPDLTITYYSRGTPLLMSVASEADTTLVVNLPDGTWRCNDDATSSTLNPRLYFADGMSGRYAVWVGTYSPGTEYPLAQFRATTQLQ
jgi:hypothetical protein